MEEFLAKAGDIGGRVVADAYDPPASGGYG